MKVFHEMVSLVTKQRLDKIDTIDESQASEKDNLYLQLYKGISNGTFTTDEDAAAVLYQTSANDKKYQMLKSRLKERLINTLFFINHKKANESAYHQAVYQCNRNYFCSKLLLTHGARTSAIAMAKSTLVLSEKFDLNEISLLCARMLRHHCSMVGLKKEYKYYDELVTTALKKVRAENRAEFMYDNLVSEFAQTKAYRPELEAIAKEYFNQSKDLAKYQKTFHLTLFHYRIGVLYYQIIMNYKSLFDLCNRFQEFTKKNHRFYIASREGEIALTKMLCCLNLKDYRNGKQNAEDALRYYKKGSNNWFVVMENYFQLTMHSGKYEEATLLFEETTSNNRFHLLPPEKKESWKIFEAYLHYLLPGKLTGKDFRITKFVNEVPIFTKDKLGYYPAILIAQILFLLDQSDEDRLEKNVESLRIFSSRYLLGKKAPRTALFIKMLRQMVNYNYDFKKVRSRTFPYLEKLKATSLNSSSEIDTMEIVGYENLWQILMMRLEAARSHKSPQQSSQVK